jgi:hypothetical protein
MVQVFNWQTGAKLAGGTTSGMTQISATLHASQLIDDSSLVYLAPEAISGGADGSRRNSLARMPAERFALSVLAN